MDERGESEWSRGLPEHIDLELEFITRSSNLKYETVQGSISMVISQSIRMFARLLSTAVIARILMPEDFGLIAMVAGITNLIMALRDAGFATAIIQRPELSAHELNNLFWINAAVNSIFMLLILASAPLAGKLYSEPRVVMIMVAYSLIFIAGGISAPFEAILKRRMKFRRLAAIYAGASVISNLVGIFGAIIGMGYWAIVLIYLLDVWIILIGIWNSVEWRPGKPEKLGSALKLVVFGSNVVGFNLANYFSRNSDTILIGWRWGPRALGFYDKGYDLLLMPLRQINTPLTPVMLSTLSKLIHDPERYVQFFIKALRIILMVTTPLIIFMIVSADLLVKIVLGNGWDQSAMIFKALGLVALTQPLTFTTSWLFISQDRTHELLIWGFLGGLLTVAAIVIGLPWGILGVALSYSLSGVFIRMPLLLWMTCRKGPVKLRHQVDSAIPGVAAALLSLISLIYLQHYLQIDSILIKLILLALTTMAVSFLTYLILPAGRGALQETRQLVFDLVKQPKVSE